jgi:hypothetical protein
MPSVTMTIACRRERSGLIRDAVSAAASKIDV